MKKLPLSFLIPLFFLLFNASPAFAVSDCINVLLNGKCQSGNISGTAMSVTDASGNHAPISGTYNVSASGKRITIGSYQYILPVVISSSSLIAWDKTRYYGDITFKSVTGGFAVGNTVDVELYLRGVIKYEMDPKWHIEALKAQAIIARTFAVRSTGKHGEYDLCAANHCQVYKGTKAEAVRANDAIKSTEGMILRWNGNPASIFYHSDSGGMVTGAGSVWGSDIPYLKPRPDPAASKGPNSEWHSAVSMLFIQSKLTDKGIDLGTISSVKPLKRDKSGRVLSLEICGSQGKKIISGYRFRSIVGADKIKSTLFEIGVRTPISIPYQAQPQPSFASPAAAAQDKHKPLVVSDTSNMPEDKEEKLIWMAQNKIFTAQELMEMLSKPDNIDSYIETGTARMEGRLPVPSDEQPKNIKQKSTDYSAPQLSMAAGTGQTLMFYGRGSGHGVGLSQYGAKALADNGWDYTQILAHYFPGTTISQ